MNNLKQKVLELIESNAKLTPDQLAVMLDSEPSEIKALVAELEADGVIAGYAALIDWDKTDKESVTAFIEIKVSPKTDRGFEEIAERIYQYPEVRDMHLMSGVYDFLLLIEGRTLKEVALFVAERLSPIEGVISTSTHFVLRRYKDKGRIFIKEPVDEREGLI